MKKIEEGVIPSTNLFWVVGIGASAGGLDAFKQLIKAIPVKSGMAYILVQHLDPNHESILVELLQKSTTIPIHEIVDNVHVEPDQIYVIPPNKFLTATDGVLKLTDRSAASQKGMSIDLFFNSLAEVHESQAIGVVLSGTGRDGTLGLKAIKDHGGITFAQQQQTAAYNEMPQSAIDADVVDFILSPIEIIPHLLNLNSIWKNKAPEERLPTPRLEDLTIKKILGLVEMQKEVDFSYYKQTTIHRRISRRMLLKNITQTEKYYRLLKDNPNEIDILYQDILIPVTDFFRDLTAFDQLCNTVLPELIKGKSETESLRAWVVGCSTGQEAFSIAICLHEFLEHHAEKLRIQIFATDISETGIDKARSGIYSPNDVVNISAARLKKYFNKVPGGYQVNKLIRDQCVFARHNILVDPPFANIDLLTCRNVLIYMDTYLQRKAMEVFHYALRLKGILMLGKSESVGISSDLFGSFSDTDKIYLRNSVPGRSIHITSKRKEEALSTENNSLAKDHRNNDDFQRNAEAVILSKSSAGVIVNDQLDIVQFRGNTGEWLEPAPGKPSLNVLKMAKHDLVLELRSTLLKARKKQEAVITEGISMQINGWKKIVSIEVTPLANTINPYFLIQFKNTEEVLEKKKNGKAKTNSHEIRSNQLEKELKQTRDDMRTFAEEQEAGHEELLSANEELASGSEELRSLNEELEISKEELQSTIEELSAANQELAVRNEELDHYRKYSEAIVTTIREPLIVLDKNLRIKSANNSFYKTFQQTEQTADGKFFYELGNKQWDMPDLRKLLERTLQEESFYESYEVKRNFASIGERTMLLNARRIFNEGNNEDLILLAIEDITERRTLEEKLKKTREYTEAIVTTIREPLIVLDKDLRIKSANSSFYKTFIETEQDTEGKLFYELGNNQWDIPELRTLLERTLQEQSFYESYEVKRNFSSIGERIMLLNARRIFNEGNSEDLILLAIEDITERRILEEKLKKTREYTEAIVTTIREPLIVLDKDLRVKSANSSFYKTFLETEQETEGKLFYELANNQWDIPDLRTLLERTLQDQMFYESYEVKRSFSSIGNRIMLLNARRIFNEGNNEDLILLAIEDVTERRTLEEKLKKNSEYLKAILDSSPQISWTASADGTVTYFNQFFLTYSGLSLEQAIAPGWEGVIHHSMVAEVTKSWNDSVTTGKDFYKELLLKRHDGVYRWHISRAIAIRNNDSVITSWVGTTTDVHDPKMFSEELEKEVKNRTQLLKEVNFDLVQSNENLEQFAFIASHDLQEPLRKIKTFSNMLLSKFATLLPDEGKNLVDKIHSSSNRMSVLIQDVLSFSRIETSKNAFVSTNLTTVLNNVVLDLNLLITDKNALVNYGELPIINAIPFQMNQLFVNLLSNSLKFVRENIQPVITITSSILTPEQTLTHPSLNQDLSYYEILFIDNGIGFDEKYADKIFQIFQRLHSLQEFRGTGIGLALCKKIALHHHGEIFATSDGSSGTTIHIIFPHEHFMASTV